MYHCRLLNTPKHDHVKKKTYLNEMYCVLGYQKEGIVKIRKQQKIKNAEFGEKGWNLEQPDYKMLHVFFIMHLKFDSRLRNLLLQVL